MNSQIKDKFLKTRNDDGKNHQAYSMEVSRLKRAKSVCEETENCEEFNRLGGDARYNEIKSMVDKERDINYNKKKTGMDTGRENQFQKSQDPTEIALDRITKSADHSGPSTTNKIMPNSQALKSRKKDILTNKEALSEEISKEISEIRYLIEYMNNNNNKQNL
jgi:hypothetical protein